MLDKLKETANFIVEATKTQAKVGIILGTGLGGLVDEIEVECELDYGQILHFPISTVDGHQGKLIFGKLGGKDIVAMQGRFHFYEGYDMNVVTYPIRVLKLIGIETLIVSNASGGLNPDYVVGDIMVIEDHINMFGTNPLIGANIDELGPRFPDMSQPYDKEYIKKAFEIADENNIKLVKGVYVGTTGPTFETPAEYKMFRILGADAVGMSTVPEVIVAKHMDMKCFGVSVITDSGVPGEIVEVSHEEVQEVANKVTPKLTTVIKQLLASF